MKKECSDFPLFCSVSDLSELGSGVVLYFYLLRFLAGMLLVAAILQIPMMVSYMNADKLHEWQLLHRSDAYSWTHSYHNARENNNACACIGVNNGMRSPSSSIRGTDSEY